MNKEVVNIFNIELNKLDNDNKISFIYLTGRILKFQEKYNYNILDAKYKTIFYSYPSYDFNNNELKETYNNNFNLFKNILNLLNIYNPIQKLDNLYDNIINNNRELFINFINNVILINIIKKQLQNKNIKDIIEYKLIDKLHNINNNDVIIGMLNLSILYINLTENQYQIFINNTYNYHNIYLLSTTITKEEYYKIYNIFHSFI